MIPDGFKMEVGIPLDDDGYLDRECPSDICGSMFKIEADDWRNKIRSEEVFCPICGHQDTSDKWMTEDQMEHCKSRLLAAVMPMLNAKIFQMADDFNRKQPRNALIRMSMTCRPSRPVTIVPVEADDLMRQRYSCEICQCRYAAVGAAFFCPSCGHNSARSAFFETVNTVRRSPQVYVALINGLSKDDAANAYRVILEENMNKVVASFQRFAEAMFETLPNHESYSPRKNIFQNLDESSGLWDKAIGRRYESMVDGQSWLDLRKYFQQRHILAHKDGIIDESYLSKSNDLQYKLGQRLVVKEQDVVRFSDLAESLAVALRSSLIKYMGENK